MEKSKLLLVQRFFGGSQEKIRAVGEGDVGRFDAYAEMGIDSIVVDLDVDGVQDHSRTFRLFSYKDKICRGEGPMDGFTAAADLDLDGLGEIRRCWKPTCDCL